MRALVVDDSRAMRLILTRILTGLGFEVYEAGDGREALDLLTADGSGTSLVLIDWNMPVMNGLDLVTAVRADENLRHLTLIMVSTESEQKQIVRALAAGAHEYLIKPFTPDAIADKLTLLGLSAAHTPA
ncbi:response regulator [Planosporangium flavigriseum]|uniref:Chemotaxis protein CheY n=1 Tax=Planosporangium flavigriseum TaxID=373681 RepID=A0A8J3PNN2_9ACTN|nr:response regulator [Planosporangium flavigriseum]NJC66465.1 response regulator [Planosporangium flavigriseum]GIG76771.1 chemotaxis protein CheY [Planosporangium flavigriseum]